jgi:hypothetical protein
MKLNESDTYMYLWWTGWLHMNCWKWLLLSRRRFWTLCWMSSVTVILSVGDLQSDVIQGFCGARFIPVHTFLQAAPKAETWRCKVWWLSGPQGKICSFLNAMCKNLCGENECLSATSVEAETNYACTIAAWTVNASEASSCDSVHSFKIHKQKQTEYSTSIILYIYIYILICNCFNLDLLLLLFYILCK